MFTHFKTEIKVVRAFKRINGRLFGSSVVCMFSAQYSLKSRVKDKVVHDHVRNYQGEASIVGVSEQGVRVDTQGKEWSRSVELSQTL